MIKNMKRAPISDLFYHLSRRVIQAILLFCLMSTKAVAGNEPIRIIIFGDSLTAGPGVAAQDTLPAQLERRLIQHGYLVVVINAGVSGDTTEMGLARVAYTLEDVPFQIAIIELGANDMLRGLDPKRAQANLEQLISAFQAKGVRVLVATMVSSENWGQTYKANFDSIYPQLSRKYGVPLIPFMMEGVWGDPRQLIGDGLHPNAAGIAKMVDHMLPEVEKMLSSMASEKK